MDLRIGYLVEWSFIDCNEAYIVNCTFLIASIRIFVLYVKYTFFWFKLLYVWTHVVGCILMCKWRIPTLWLSLMPESAASPHHILEVVHKKSVALVVTHTEANFAALKWTVYYDSIYMIMKIQVIFLLCVTDYYYYYYYFTFHFYVLCSFKLQSTFSLV